jgi:hypothetical protein
MLKRHLAHRRGTEEQSIVPELNLYFGPVELNLYFGPVELNLYLGPVESLRQHRNLLPISPPSD